MSRFTKIPQDTFSEIQVNAGVLLKTFDPANPTEPKDEDIICATTGGINASCVPTYSDMGSDVDNSPVNIKYSCVMFQDIHGCFAKWAYYPAIAS